jgi:hypothetical protein
MTHDELLAKIYDSTNGLKYEDIFILLIENTNALRAVVELHKPVMGFTGGYDGEENELWEEQCQECSSNGFSQMYPCETIQVIEKELE